MEWTLHLDISPRKIKKRKEGHRPYQVMIMKLCKGTVGHFATAGFESHSEVKIFKFKSL